mmetsp:Transcript_107491/g.210694  ORF Transcript_107491/g.210694 Transcript_107491/m.210694 type:complete len:205 (-) Transcript_107491:178-792(-)
MDVSCSFIIHGSVGTNAQSNSGNSLLPLFVMNLEFSKRLKRLEYKGMVIQYQLACLSTLGGAYHLTNRPETAFMIAHRQEMVGRLLGSISVVIRAKVFQAVNLYLLGHKKASKRVFEVCRRLASDNLWSGMTAFVEASELWLSVQRSLQQSSISHVDNGSSWGSSQAAIGFSCAPLSLSSSSSSAPTLTVAVDPAAHSSSICAV